MYMMPLTAAQSATFYEQDNQMGIQNDIVVQLQQEGITTVDDLSNLGKGTMEQIAANIWRPAGRIPYSNSTTTASVTIPDLSFVFGA